MFDWNGDEKGRSDGQQWFMVGADKVISSSSGSHADAGSVVKSTLSACRGAVLPLAMGS